VAEPGRREHNDGGVELLLFLPLVVFKAVVMGGILWWALRTDADDEEDDGEGGLRVDVEIGPRPPSRWVPRRRSPRGPHASPVRGPRRVPVR
jgi:hypothetical protein